MPIPIGYSPDILRDELKEAGGDPISLGAKVAAARQGHVGASPKMEAMPSGDRAALDRYATFYRMAQQDKNPIKRGINYLGGMGAMGLTEGVKLIPGAQKALTAVQGKVLGSAAEPFGGKDTSEASLANLAASHQGFVDALEAENPGTTGARARAYANLGNKLLSVKDKLAAMLGKK